MAEVGGKNQENLILHKVMMSSDVSAKKIPG